ncbi:MAG: hypothetical protein R3E58_19175 [Phycisphaerae bacterium]|nr:hypothetical protein [Phycisphaerales bacterium]
MTLNQLDMQRIRCSRTLMLAGLLVVVATTRSSAVEFFWQGDNNDNWVNPGNWEQNPGSGDIPETPNDNVTFDSLADRMDVDLNGNTYDIGDMTVQLAPFQFHQGTLRIHEGLSTFVKGDTLFRSDVTIEQVNNDYWDIYDSSVIMEGQLVGSANITLDGNGNITFSAINPYSGTLRIGFTEVILGHPNALQDCTVHTYSNPGGLRVNGLDAVLGALSGVGTLNIGATTLSVGRINTNTIFDGNINGTGSLVKQGTGSLTLGGSMNNLNVITNSSGTLSLSGGGTIRQLLVPAGDTTIRSSALNMNNEEGNVFHISGDGNASIKNGAVVTLPNSGLTNRTVLTNDADLTIEDSGSMLISPRLDIGPSGAGSSQVVVQNDGAIVAERIRVGDLASDNGAAGRLTVLSGGSVETDMLWFSRRGHVDITEATLSTNILGFDNNISPVISISDPFNGTALTVGVNGGNSTVEALIENSSAGAGSIRKEGSGVLELRNANTYSGNTSVYGGTLLANNTMGTATGSSNVHIRNGGTLGGDGSVSNLAVVYNGGTVTPGNPIGELNAGTIAFHNGSTLEIELADTDTHDKIVATGTSNLGGTLDISYANGFTAQEGDSFIILTAPTLLTAFDNVNYPDAQPWWINYDYVLGIVSVGICNSEMDINDYARFADCMNGPSAEPDPNCDCFDLDDDGDVDAVDFAGFQTNFNGN